MAAYLSWNHGMSWLLLCWDLGLFVLLRRGRGVRGMKSLYAGGLVEFTVAEPPDDEGLK